MKKVLFIVISVLLLTTLSFTSFAHSGRTDSNGGHRDNINGGYHYHHGYPAHQHPNGECPYIFDNNTSSISKNDIIADTTDYVALIIMLIAFTVFIILAIISEKICGNLFEIPFSLFIQVMSLPFLIIYYIFIALFFIIKIFLFALPPKKPYKLKPFQRYWINIEKINKKYIRNDIVDDCYGREYCELVAESEKYYFYSYRTYSDGSGGYILRRDKKNKDKIVYFGESKEFNIAFHDYLFQIDKKGIIGKNIEDGTVQHFNWLSTKSNFTLNGNFGRYYSQDSVKDIYIDENKLVLKISRVSSHEEPNDIYNRTMVYNIVVNYNNGKFEATKIFPPLT